MTLFYTIWYFLDLSYIRYVDVLRRTRKEVVVTISETVAIFDMLHIVLETFTK